MSERGLKNFIEAIASDPNLAQIFAGVAQGAGFDVNAADFRNLGDKLSDVLTGGTPLAGSGSDADADDEPEKEPFGFHPRNVKRNP